MRRRRLLLTLLAILAVTAALGRVPDHEVRLVDVPLPDGGTVLCAISDHGTPWGHGRGLSCDWWRAR